MVPVGKTKAVNDTFLLVKLANCMSVIFTGVEPMFFLVHNAWLMVFANI